jgi:hypothetical protein
MGERDFSIAHLREPEVCSQKAIASNLRCCSLSLFLSRDMNQQQQQRANRQNGIPRWLAIAGGIAKTVVVHVGVNLVLGALGVDGDGGLFGGDEEVGEAGGDAVDDSGAANNARSPSSYG